MSSLPAKGAGRPSGALSVASPYVSAMLGEERSALLQRVVEGLPPETLHWLSGYFAGLATQRGPAQELAPVPVAQAVPESWLTIIYGTQTGNSRLLAERLKHQAEASGVSVRLYRASTTRSGRSPRSGCSTSSSAPRVTGIRRMTRAASSSSS